MAANPVELGVIRVAKPCHRDWEKMSGDARSRFCADCQLNVFNLSEMTTEEARELIREKEGQLCVRFYQRADGTVLTRDCPVGVAKQRRKVIVAAGAAVASAAGLAAFALSDSPPPPVDAPVAIEAGCDLPEPAATTAPTPAAPDDGWIEKRRGQLGGRERSPGQLVMGRMNTIQVIKKEGK